MLGELKDAIVRCFEIRRRRHRVASLGRRVAPPWPLRMACLQRLAGTDHFGDEISQQDLQERV